MMKFCFCSPSQTTVISRTNVCGGKFRLTFCSKEMHVIFVLVSTPIRRIFSSVLLTVLFTFEIMSFLTRLVQVTSNRWKDTGPLFRLTPFCTRSSVSTFSVSLYLLLFIFINPLFNKCRTLPLHKNSCPEEILQLRFD